MDNAARQDNAAWRLFHLCAAVGSDDGVSHHGTTYPPPSVPATPSEKQDLSIFSLAYINVCYRFFFPNEVISYYCTDLLLLSVFVSVSSSNSSNSSSSSSNSSSSSSSSNNSKGWL